MPLNPHTVPLAFQSALGGIRAGGTQADIGAIAKELMAKFPTDPPTPFVSYLNIVRQADQAWRSGADLDIRPNDPHTIRGVPIDPSIGPGNPRFAYTVIVTAHRQDGTKTDTRIIVRSSDPMSYEDIRQQAESAVSNGVQESSSNPDGVRGNGVTHYTVTVVSAGRSR